MLLIPALAVAGLLACTDTSPDAAAVAVAKCSAALHERFGLAENEHIATSDVEVTGTQAGRRVTGAWEGDGAAGAGRFDCTVVPDDSDTLRGLRVDDLQVQVLEP